MTQSTVWTSLPDPRDLRRLVFRGVLLSVTLRVTVHVLWLALKGQLGLTGNGVLSPPASVLLIVMVAVGAAAETRRAGEVLFAGNLGQHPAWPAGVAAGIAGVMELAVALVA